MNNIKLVTEHLNSLSIPTLTVIETVDGALLYECELGAFRMYNLVENAEVFQNIENVELFENAGRAFGDFQKALDSFDASKLVETIERFHDTPHRFKTFLSSLERNASKRAHLCKEEIDFLLERKDTFDKVVSGIESGEIPLRVTHNDTKLNNILFDRETGKATVIDLDTVMPGSMLYDFGDAIRYGANTAAEDEKDLQKVKFDISLFEAFARGFCGSVKERITQSERELLPYSAYLLTMECGMRFLTDFIDGDTYFGTKYPEHNLVRCRTQFALARQMEEKMSDMKKITDEFCK